MVLDEFNYNDGKFCPLAIGLELDKKIENPTQEKVFNRLEELWYSILNTKGIKGKFYTTNRKDDLMLAAKEVLEEKLNQK